METLELILFLLVAVAASSILDKLLPRLSLPLVQIALGAVIALLVATPLESGLDPELLLILFIAPLHFNESRHADSGQLWANRWGIASLAAGLVFAIIISVGFTLHALLPMIPLAAALAFGAAMGSTDAVAVMELSKDFKFGKRHESLLAGEAFFNDVTGTVVFQCAIAMAVSGTFSITHAGEEFALDFFGGFAGGVVLGFAAWALLEFIKRRGVDSPTLHVTLELLIPFLIYLACEQIHIGGIIAVVMAGMVMSLMPHRHTPQTARQKLQSRGVWDTISFILNGIIFVILGMQLPQVLVPETHGGIGNPLLLIGIIACITFVLEGVRFVWILGMDAVAFRRADRSEKARFLTKTELTGALAMAFAGPKGGITLSLMLTIPAALSTMDLFPVRETMVSIASGVILLTLLLANFAVPALVPHREAMRKTRDRTDTEARLIMSVIASIEHDAPKTGVVVGEDARTLMSDTDDVDEPATAIVLKRYSDMLEELLPHASTGMAKDATEVIRACNASYDRLGDITREVAAIAEDDDEGAVPDDAPTMTDRFRELRAIYDAVEDVQAQALVRELDIIKHMHDAGEISSAHARELRNDVYIQQLTL